MRWMESPLEVRREVVEFFTRHTELSAWERPKLDGVHFESFMEVENVGVVSPSEASEIEEVVKGNDGNRSPNTDEFNLAFFKEFWHLLNNKIRIFFDPFHAKEIVPRGLLAYFVTRIPKINSPMELKDFRLVSLLGCTNKLLSKVLSRRLAKFMDLIISFSQSAFIKGRNLIDRVLVVDELVNFAKKAKKECLILKVDFEKAYDSVDWGFWEYMLNMMGFWAKWVWWIKTCVFGGTMSILVNGSPTEEINIQRGLKQGDPLAPFSFLLVAEGFSGLMRNVVHLKLFEGFRFKRDGLEISHL